MWWGRGGGSPYMSRWIQFLKTSVTCWPGSYRTYVYMHAYVGSRGSAPFFSSFNICPHGFFGARALLLRSSSTMGLLWRLGAVSAVWTMPVCFFLWYLFSVISSICSDRSLAMEDQNIAWWAAWKGGMWGILWTAFLHLHQSTAKVPKLQQNLESKRSKTQSNRREKWGVKDAAVTIEITGSLLFMNAEFVAY